MLARLRTSGLRYYRECREQLFGVFLIAKICNEQFLSVLN